MSEVIKVGMADLNVCKAPDVITTLGLGSCIGLVLYDPVTKVGGMVHYMLPDSTKVRNNSNIAKFGDTGIRELLKRVVAAGASKPRLIAVEALCQRYPGKVDVLLAPAASVIYPEKVPANAPLLDEDAYLDQLSSAVQAAGGRFVDVRQTLAEHKDEYIYYRTDHHWTSLGAYYAYQQLCGALSLTPFDPAAHTALTAENFYGTHYSKARTWNAVPDTITYYDLPNTLTIWNVTAAGQPTDGQTTGLYDTDKLSVYDKYAMFLHGNNGLSRIEGNGTGRILVIKDSYANCFAPYLTANYAEIDVVDFRNYNYGLDQLIADNGYDQILVLYSFDSFKSDPYLYRAGVTG